MKPEAFPSDMLLTDIAINLLTPLFLSAAQGDPATARQAARSMLLSCGARTDAELLTSVQIVAFLMASISMLSLAMSGDLAPTLMLRAMGCAERLSKAEQRHRQIFQAQQQQSAPKPRPPELPPELQATLAMPFGMQKPPARGPADFTPEEHATLLEATMHGTVETDAYGNPIVPLDVQIAWRKSFAERLDPIADELAASAPALPADARQKRMDRIDRIRRSAAALRQGEPMPRFPNGSILDRPSG